MRINSLIITQPSIAIEKINNLNFRSHSKISMNICTSAEWLSIWISKYLRKCDRLYLVIHSIDDLDIAVYPMYLKKLSLGFELRFIGTGESENCEVCSEFQDFLIDDLFLFESIKIFTNVVKNLRFFYSIKLEKILVNSNCYKWVKYHNNNLLSIEKLIGLRYIIPVLVSEKLQIELLENKTLRRHARKFISRQDIDIKYCGNKSQIKCYLNSLAELHNSAWKKRGKTGAFTCSKFLDFHIEFAEKLFCKHDLVLFKMLINNVTVAVFYGFYNQKTLYYYQSGISDLSNLSNTGVAMHLIALRHARSNNANFYDLMLGNFDSYKQGYIESKQNVVTFEKVHPLLFLFNKTIKKFKFLISILSVK